jgi:hypothetical protein
MKRAQPEEQLQVAVCKYLRHALEGNSMFFAVPNGGLRSRTEAIRFKATGTIPGIPDICVVNDGRLIGIELKAPKGRVSDAQLYCHERLRRARVPVTICRSIDDVIAALTAAGVPLKARIAA